MGGDEGVQVMELRDTWEQKIGQKGLREERGGTEWLRCGSGGVWGVMGVETVSKC